MLPVIPHWFHLLEMAVVLTFALARGEREERWAAVFYTGSNLASIFAFRIWGYQAWLGFALAAPDPVFFVWLMLRSDKYWTLLACSLALLEVATATALLALPFTSWAYGTAQLFWYYGILLTIAVGTWLTSKRGEVS